MQVMNTVAAISIALLYLAASVSAQQGLGDPSSVVTYDEWYVDGLKAYTAQKWSTAISYFRHALEDYNRTVQARSKCFEKCLRQKAAAPSDYADDSELRFFHAAIQRAACIERCREDYVGARPVGGVPSYIVEHMEKKEVYNYLQMALHQDGKTREAAKACSTFSYHNPRNIHVQANMMFYKGQPSVSEEDLDPLESKSYRDLYAEGQRHYFAEEWDTMVEKFELALEEFYPALEKCRQLCNGPLRYTKTLDFAQAMTKLFISLLECRSSCVESLGDFRSDRAENFLGTFFHYLQFGYHNLNRSVEAIQSSATQVRLEPHSEIAKRNAVFYRQQQGVTRKDFVPREDVLPHIERLEEEHSFLHIVDELSGHLTELGGAGGDGERNEVEGNDVELLEQDFQTFPVGRKEGRKEEEEEEETTPVVVQTSADLKGPERVVVDRLISEKQCQQLMDLASYGSEGDGYSQKSPHTTREKFEGLNILEAAKKAVEGTVSRSLSRLYANASKRVLDRVAKEFGLKTPLYFSYTHLVCRTAKEALQRDRKDLSHPVHSDNCILNEMTGECNKVPPAYTWRDYSAILYLNEEFEGGKFFFAHSTTNLSPQVYVTPKCGRMVGFSAGKENMHGVTAVTKGRRCAVALWFTLDPNHKEATFDKAESMLSSIVS